MGASTRVLFLDAADDVLVRRYEATRRRHPLAAGDRVSDGIASERNLLEELKGQADIVLDTTELNVHELRARLRELFDVDHSAGALQTSIVSFGYKHGLPLDVDLVFDCRFLPNPHWVDELRPLTGADPRVRDYVMGLPETAELLEKTLSLLEYVVPKYEREGKSYLTIAFGCTGGMHRSVVLAEHVATALDSLLHERASRPSGTDDEPTPKIEVAVVHRDVARGEPSPKTRTLTEGSILPPSTGAAEHAGDLGSIPSGALPAGHPRSTTRGS